LITVPVDRIHQVAARALKAGWQVNVHAIGDRANRMVLNEFEMALKEVPKADHRFRVEHAQIIHYDDIPRFAQLGVIPSMQGSHATSDMYWAVNRIGPTRVLGAYAWRSLLNTGVVIPNGSDFPVESVNPLISFHAAVSRQDAENWPASGWFPEQRMTREEALRSMTIWPAQRSGWEAPPVLSGQSLKTVLLVAWVGGVGGVGACFLMARGLIAASRFSALSIVSWACGELVALVGGVHFMLTADPRWY